MRGVVKAGLLFGLIGLIVALLPLPALFGVSLLPIVAYVLLVVLPVLLLFGPLALLLGGLAGYFAARWSEPATIGRGLLAAGLAGTAVLLGNLIFIVAVVTSLTSTPELRQDLVRQISQQFSQQGGNADLISQSFEGIFILAGLCAGTINLLLALGPGAFGAWLVTRRLPDERSRFS